MMPAIIISFVFSKQVRLILGTTPLKDELACLTEVIQDVPNWIGVQIRPLDFPWGARSKLLAL